MEGKMFYSTLLLDRCTPHYCLSYDVNVACVLIILFLSFQKFTTFITVSLSLFVGLVILGE